MDRPSERALLTLCSAHNLIKLHIGNGLVRISARMVGILLKFMIPERELQRLTSESGVSFEGQTTRI